MLRPRTTGHLAAPAARTETPTGPSSSDVATVIGQALLALVIVVEGQSSAGPAVKAYQAAIRRNGEEAAAAGEIDAMEAALRFVIDGDPDRAKRRESIILKAWAGLPGWRS